MLLAYNEALLDITRLVISYHWYRIKASTDVLELRKDKLGRIHNTKTQFLQFGLHDEHGPCLEIWMAMHSENREFATITGN